MRKKYLLLLFTLLILVLLPACQKESPVNSDRAVVAITSDVESLNPLFAFDINEGNITELLYDALVQHKWNYEKGTMDTYPMLAKSWTWDKDSTSITLDLRNDVYWSDGKQFTAEDVVFSFDVYSDPEVQSRLYGSFKNFYTDKRMHIDLKKTFDVENPFLLKINFRKNSNPSFYDIDFPLIAEHVYGKLSRKDFITGEKEIKPVTDGAFSLSDWNKNQAIILKANKKSFLYNPDNISEIIFKIVPDYNSQITQLKKGEIDMMEDIKADDVPNLRKDADLVISPLKGREYDYVGWNNIDPEAYAKNKTIKPNPLFGSPVVREALTYAINRGEILQEFLNNYGQPAAGPVAPIFTSALDTDLKPLPYNPDKAKALLASAGWKQTGPDGTLMNGNRKFSFTLYIPSGNPRREFAANIIQNNLKILGISVNIEKMEPGVFFQNVYGRKFNAWMAGWSVPIPLDLKDFWYSDLAETPSNLAGYMNKKVDALLDKIETVRSEGQKNILYKKVEDMIYADNPVTFLYWIDNIIAYNKRIRNFKVTPLGPLSHCWEWSVKQ